MLPSTATTTATHSPTASARPTFYEITGPLRIDAETGRVFAAGKSGDVLGTLVLDAHDGRLIRLIAGIQNVALAPSRSRLVLDRPGQGIMLFDTRSLDRIGVYQVPTPSPPNERDFDFGLSNVDPIVDPRDGTIYVVRGAHVLAVDPESGRIARVIEDWIPGNPNLIRQALFDPESRTLYITAYDLETAAYMHAVDLVGRNLDTGAIVLADQVSDFYDRLLVWDGHLLAMDSWGRGNLTNMRLWHDGQLLHSVENWPLLNQAGIVRDAMRGRLLMQTTYDEHDGYLLSVIDTNDLSLDVLTTSPAPGRLYSYDSVSDQLYFVDESLQLRVTGTLGAQDTPWKSHNA
jgi:hypothetical protein